MYVRLLLFNTSTWSTILPQEWAPSVAKLYFMYLYPVPDDGRMNCRNMQLKNKNNNSSTQVSIIAVKHNY